MPFENTSNVQSSRTNHATSVRYGHRDTQSLVDKNKHKSAELTYDSQTLAEAPLVTLVEKENISHV